MASNNCKRCGSSYQFDPQTKDYGVCPSCLAWAVEQIRLNKASGTASEAAQHTEADSVIPNTPNPSGESKEQGDELGDLAVRFGKKLADKGAKTLNSTAKSIANATESLKNEALPKYAKTFDNTVKSIASATENLKNEALPKYAKTLDNTAKSIANATENLKNDTLPKYLKEFKSDDSKIKHLWDAFIQQIARIKYCKQLFLVSIALLILSYLWGRKSEKETYPVNATGNSNLHVKTINNNVSSLSNPHIGREAAELKSAKAMDIVGRKLHCVIGFPVDPLPQEHENMGMRRLQNVADGCLKLNSAVIKDDVLTIVLAASDEWPGSYPYENPPPVPLSLRIRYFDKNGKYLGQTKTKETYISTWADELLRMAYKSFDDTLNKFGQSRLLISKDGTPVKFTINTRDADYVAAVEVSFADLPNLLVTPNTLKNAVITRNKDIPIAVQSLLRERKIDISNITKDVSLGYELARDAAYKGQVDALSWLQSLGVDIKCVDDEGQTLMHYAARGNSVTTMEWLKDQGFDIDGKASSGITPVIEAVYTNSLDSMKWLISNGIDLNKKIKNAPTLMMAAAQSDNKDLIKWLKEQGVSMSGAMIGAARANNLFLMQWLKEQGADIDERDWNGKTSVTWAALTHAGLGRNTDGTLRWLKEQGADINIRDSTGKTPFAWAVIENKYNAMIWLGNNGANVNTQDSDGKTPLDYIGSTQYASWDRKVSDEIQKFGGVYSRDL